MMKKLLSTLLVSTVVFAGAQAVSAQDVVGPTDNANISVKGTLGADNTDPDTTIPEGDKDWINVTLPTETIFYNTAAVKDIQAPTYTITNNSGRPVKISVAKFDANINNPTPLPGDFALNLKVTGPSTGNAATTASTPLVVGGVIQTPTNELITLANSSDQYVKTDALVPKGSAVNNTATFTYSGTATTTTALKLSYTLGLKFEAVKF